MQQLIEQLQSIDLSEPGALLNVLMLLLTAINWWWLIWVTVIINVVCALVGAAIGWYKGTIWRDTLLGAALGPIGWIISLVLPSSQSKCSVCGCTNRMRARCCDQCGSKLLQNTASTKRL